MTKTPALARYAEKAISPVTASFIEFIENETGYTPDPLSVSIALDIHGLFQKSPANQKRTADAAARRAAEATARAERKAAREAKAAEPKPAPAKPAPKKPVAKAAAK
jgi:hypothetical protein